MSSVRVVVADDHPLYRFGLRAALDAEDGVEVVGEAATGRELLDVAARHRPDVVVTDVSMPDLDGVAATRELRSLLPRVAVLVVTMHEDNATVRAALRAGAAGYLVKGADRGELARAVRTVAHSPSPLPSWRRWRPPFSSRPPLPPSRPGRKARRCGRSSCCSR